MTMAHVLASGLVSWVVFSSFLSCYFNSFPSNSKELNTGGCTNSHGLRVLFGHPIAEVRTANMLGCNIEKKEKEKKWKEEKEWLFTDRSGAFSSALH
ncbi:hypothetical protein BGW36DRAFT_387757 [Talaromyces proteolyticus]|uniref:Secreted protein n=1 Tax=Talaromyces proteolyticus TaxID=1131652 RepID=A0AAD4KFX1_9EURO|nr:uncharacterized protein BGW36DRAFT_387757 [Talaromyces proteolyticus]KAH8691139.1 hypothetical protein BGW36DRAFT_387757 [Talaromyces proteolyticus]